VIPRPRWLSLDIVNAIHDESLAHFGGAAGIRDAGLLESALARPQNLLAYGDAPTIFDLAAAYGSGIIRNHPFVDGNKRTGLLAINAFLALNGYRFDPEQTDEVRTILGVAGGTVGEDRLAAWIAAKSQPK
jgi:death-on-curing protein